MAIDFCQLAGIYATQLGVQAGDVVMVDSRATTLDLANEVVRWLKDNRCEAVLVDQSKARLTAIQKEGKSFEELSAELQSIFNSCNRRLVIYDPHQPNPEDFDAKWVQSWAGNVFSPIQRNANESGMPWLVINPPSAEFAVALGMDQDALEEFYFNACCIDYGAMRTAAEPLQKLLETGKKVRILSGDHTDISFEMVNYAVVCCGERNFPDGECFTAPVKESVNGRIRFGPSIQAGTHFPWIQMEKSSRQHPNPPN